MSIFNRKKKTTKEQMYMLNNEEWNLLAQMLYSQINSGPVINPLISKTDYITKGYAYNSTVYSIISLRANAAKGVPWLVYKVKNKQKFREYTHISNKDLNLGRAIAIKEQALEEVEGTPINKLIKEPNPQYSFASIIEGMFTYRDTTGDAYLYAIPAGSRELAQLFLMPADKIRIVPGSFVDPIKAFTFEEIYGRKELDRRNVMHWKYFNPIWDNLGRNLYGLSPLVAAARIINSDNSGLNHQNASFSNEGVKAILTGTDQTEIEFTKEQAEALRKKFKRAALRAQDGEGNLVFNRAPLQKIDIGKSPVDLGVLESQKHYKEVLCNIFRIHPSLLSSDASTLNNLQEARKALMTMSVLPDMDDLRENINNLFGRFYGEEYFVDYDIMAIQELQDDLESLGRTLSSMDWLTRNEKRTATNYDRYEMEAADMLYTTMNEIPLGYSFDSGFSEIDENLSKLRKQYKN
jgi:HK97 family phage portal protein